MMKKDMFKYHISREHQDTMLNKFMKADERNEEEKNFSTNLESSFEE